MWKAARGKHGGNADVPLFNNTSHVRGFGSESHSNMYTHRRDWLCSAEYVFLSLSVRHCSFLSAALSHRWMNSWYSCRVTRHACNMCGDRVVRFRSPADIYMYAYNSPDPWSRSTPYESLMFISVLLLFLVKYKEYQLSAVLWFLVWCRTHVSFVALITVTFTFIHYFSVSFQAKLISDWIMCIN